MSYLDLLFLSKWYWAIGTFLIVLMTSETSLLQAILVMVLAGIGCGTFFSLPMLVAQNALPASRLGVSTAAVRYTGQLGATLGIAIVGTVINSAISGDLTQHLPTSVADKLALAGALQHGFVAVLVFTVIALITTFFLKEIPMADTSPVDSVNANFKRVKSASSKLKHHAPQATEKN